MKKEAKEMNYWQKRDIINQTIFLILASATLVGAFLMQFLEDWFLIEKPELPYRLSIILFVAMGLAIIFADANEKNQIFARTILSIVVFLIQMLLALPFIILWNGPCGYIKYTKARGMQLIVNERRRYLHYLAKKTAPGKGKEGGK